MGVNAILQARLGIQIGLLIVSEKVEELELY